MTICHNLLKPLILQPAVSQMLLNIYIQMPLDPQAQHVTFSSYKDDDTIKELVAITPSSRISFESKLYGGNISDRQLTELNGLLDFLEQGDSVIEISP